MICFSSDITAVYTDTSYIIPPWHDDFAGIMDRLAGITDLWKSRAQLLLKCVCASNFAAWSNDHLKSDWWLQHWCVCVFIKLHITAQPGPVKLIFQCYSNGSALWGISGGCVCVLPSTYSGYAGTCNPQLVSVIWCIYLLVELHHRISPYQVIRPDYERAMQSRHCLMLRISWMFLLVKIRPQKQYRNRNELRSLSEKQ